MKKNNILVFCNQIYTSSSEFEIYIGSKLFEEFEKHFNVSYIGFTKKDCTIVENKYSSFVALPFAGRKVIEKIGNYFFMTWIKFNKLKKYEGDLVWIWIGGSIHHILYFLFPILFKKKLFFIQLGAISVYKSQLKRMIFDSICRFNLLFYRHIGVNPDLPAGKVLIKKHKIPQKKIIPVIVGMPDYGFSPKIFDSLKMVYLGTINTREVWKTIRGVAIFKKNNPQIEVIYDIIGGGNATERKKIHDEIEKANLNHVVKYHGPLPVEEVKSIFQRCNIGVSYVPAKDYFENNSTKTVEYLLAGMVVIATEGKVMAEIIKPKSGVFCKDNPESFANAIHECYNNFPKYNSYKIREMYEKFSMSSTMKTSYFPFLDRMIEQKIQFNKKHF